MAIKEGTYVIRRNYGGCRGYAVVGAGGIHGCHTTRASAINQQQAIYAATAKKVADENEMKDKKKKELHKAWSVVQDHPDCDGFAVVGDSGNLHGCFKTEAEANAAVSAHNNNGNDNNDSENHGDGHHRDDMNNFAKKEYSQRERDALARRDMALPDGSFPIVTVADLQNAIQSVGRASNYSKARNHIIRRAEALGRTDMLPEEWKPKSAQKAFEMTKRDVSDIDLKPTESMASNAKRGLELRDKFNRGGTSVGVARARDLSNRRDLSPETVARMYSFFSRHEVDKQGKDWDNAERPSNGKIAWLLWGGDSGFAWAKQKWEAIQNARASKSDETWKDSPFSFYK